MKKTACIALMTLLLAVGAGGAAEPSDLAFAKDNTRGAPQDILLLSPENLETVTGARWRGSSCTAGVRTLGGVAIFVGVVTLNPVQFAIGSFLVRVRCYY